uniref:Uncharacterized protein n=1 Tax=Pipistrellus kuhlii TaxID=59472 RepID=A0A7J7WD92_PIPKU|nr:hypothetical protein mPipKuh1_008055 [Pipistrellus kuhlii]
MFLTLYLSPFLSVKIYIFFLNKNKIKRIQAWSQPSGEGGGIQSRGFLCKQEARGKQHCGAGQWAGSRQALCLRWAPRAAGGWAGTAGAWLPVPGPGEELPLSWLSQEEVPHWCSGSPSQRRPQLGLGLPFLLRERVVFRANLGHRSPLKSPWPGGLGGVGKSGQAGLRRQSRRQPPLSVC